MRITRYLRGMRVLLFGDGWVLEVVGDLAPCFEGGDSDGSGQVIAADVGVAGNIDGFFTIAFEPFIGDSGLFIPENEGIPVMVCNVGINMATVFGKPSGTVKGSVIEKGVEVGVDEAFDGGPVIEPSAFQVTVGEFETKGPDKVEAKVGAGAGSSDIADVRGDAWVDEDDMEDGVFTEGQVNGDGSSFHGGTRVVIF